MFEAIYRNRVYRWNDCEYRILDKFSDFCVVIDVVAEDAMPFPLSADDIDSICLACPIKEVTDPWLEHVSRFFNKDHKYVQYCEKNLARIQGIIGAPEYWVKAKRSEMINVLTHKGFGAKSTIYRYLRKYWQRGQTPNALLPDFDNCGGPGKKKTRGDKLLGRPKEYGSFNSVQMTPELEDLMDSAIRSTMNDGKFTVNKNKQPKNVFTLKTAYTEFLSRWCGNDVKKLNNEKPSFDMFKAFYYKTFTPEERARAKSGDKYFNANYRKLHSTVSANVIGPGHEYQIDATTFDVGASGTDRMPLGRLTAYAVADSHTGGITGKYLTFTPPSYCNAMNAIVVAVMDKVEYCRKLGFEIEADDWPMQGLPKAFHGDMGSDLRGKNITSVTTQHGICMINGGAGQPEKRAHVERSFGRLRDAIKHKLPGMVSSHIPKKHGGQYKPEDYTLLLEELNVIIAKEIILINSKPNGIGQVDHDYPPDLPTTANAKWRFGIAHRTGPLHHIPHDLFWYSLLERQNATLSRGHILKVKGIEYVIPNRDGLRTKVYEHRKTEQVAIDSSDASAIYLVPKEGESDYLKCPLHEHFRRFEGLSWRDAIDLSKEVKEANANAMHNFDIAQVETAEIVKDMVKHAIEDKKNKTKGKSKNEILSKLGNKRAMREESRASSDAVKPESARPSPTLQQPSIETQENDNVVNNQRNQYFMDDED